MFKDDLMTALQDAVGQFNEGADENTAVVKAAEAADFNPDQSQRLVEMFNTTKSICFFKNAADKSATFALAEADVVQDRLFGSKRAESVKKAACAFDDLLMTGNEGYYQKEAHQVDFVAHELDFLQGKDEYKPSRAAADMTTKLANYKRMQDLAKRAGNNIEDTKYAYDQTITKIARELTLWNNSAKSSQFISAFLGDDTGLKLANDISSRMTMAPAPLVEQKYSNVDREHPELTLAMKEAEAYLGDIDFAEAIKNNVDQLVITEKQAMTAGRFEDTAFTEDFMTDSFKDLVKFAAPGDPEPKGSGGKGMGTVLKDLLTPGSTNAGPVMAAAANKQVGKEIGTAIGGSTVDAFSSLLEDPIKEDDKSLTDQAQRLHREHILTKLITTDPILRGAKPEHVAQVYNELATLAPEVSLQEPIVKSILREAVNAEAMSPYDAKSHIDLNDALKRKGMSIEEMTQSKGDRK